MTSVTAHLSLETHTQEHGMLYAEANKLYSLAVKHQQSFYLDQALTAAYAARALLPMHVGTLNLLARIELQRQNYPAAEVWIQEGLRHKPDSVSLLYSAGHIAFSQGLLEQAEHYFLQTLKISRVATKALNSLAHLKLLQGEYVEAFRHYRELAQTQADDIIVRSKLFEAANHIVADFYVDELEHDLLRYLDFKEVDHSHLRALVTSLLRHKLRLSEAGCPLEFEQLANDPLLLKSLNKFYYTDPVFERLFITLRQSMLLGCSQNLAIPKQQLALIEGLVAQCWLNESIWYVTEQEKNLIQQLDHLISKMLQLQNISQEELIPALLLVGMYQPLAQCSFVQQLDQFSDLWPDALQQQLDEYQQLQYFATRLPSLGKSSNKTSKIVQQQYDQNPYPRWVAIGYNQPSDYAGSLQQAFPHASNVLPAPGQHLETLVAGCGTGRHAIRLAKYFPSLSVTAVDLSTTALSYAAYKAHLYQQHDIHFVQGDLLNIDILEQQFDLIECSGVLHHMQYPSVGLQSLATQLRPGGVIKIALYSATARKSVTALRELLAEQRPRTLEDIRLMREALLQGSIPGDWQDLFNSEDFYSSSACRDLIFHEQEHIFDVRQLPEFLTKAGLQWIGMLPPPGSQPLLKLMGKKAHQLTIEDWYQLEQSNPAMFATMYQFYAIKPL